MTLHDVKRLIGHWQKYPPLRALVAAVAGSLGVKFPDPNEPKPSYMTAKEAARMLAVTGGRIDGIGGI